MRYRFCLPHISGCYVSLSLALGKLIRIDFALGVASFAAFCSGVAMDILLEQAHALLRENVTWFEDAARYLRILSEKDGLPDREQWALLSAVYHERADAHRKVLEEIATRSSNSE